MHNIQTISSWYNSYCLGLWRAKAGLPHNWSLVEAWLDTSGPVRIPADPVASVWKQKCPDIPFLSSYNHPPADNFWTFFPAHPLPTPPQTPLRIEVLASLLSDLAPSLSSSQQARGARPLDKLSNGVRIPFTSILPPLRVANSASTVIHGAEFTDILAWWLRQGYVAGPFHLPPFRDFRTK